ncbi:MAG: sugar ABC transporter substrate-binding protein [Lachnospiraceae bacterium]|nr:sugar ABC transporter substrate-binding protein [Lachnospiraceae bacterium]
MKKKIIATLLCASMVLATLAGCGGGNAAATDAPAPAAEPAAEEAPAPEAEAPETTEAEAPASELQGELHYAYWHDALGPYLEECKAKFEAANPGVTIVLEPTSWGEYWTKLETAASGGAVADVFQLNGPNIGKYASAGVIVPIDELLKTSDIDLSNYPEALINLYTVDNQLYGVAMDYDTIGLWYNKELFDAAGMEYPNENWTWDDMADAAKKLTSGDQYGIIAGCADQAGFYNTVPMYGGYILNDDKTKSGFSLPETRAGIQCWVDLMKAGYSPSQDSITENTDSVLFMSGKVAMMMAGDWFAAEFQSDPDFAAKVDCTYIPTVNGKRVSVIHGKANCISASTQYPEAAWKWVEYLAGPEANEILGKSGAAIPTHKDYSALYFEQFPQYNMAIFADEAQNMSCPYPASKTSAEWGDIIWNELIMAYTLETTVDEACDNIAEQMDALLASE